MGGVRESERERREFFIIGKRARERRARGMRGQGRCRSERGVRGVRPPLIDMLVCVSGPPGRRPTD
jgi:hypothetical protein